MDKIIRAISKDKKFIAIAAETGELVTKADEKFSLSPAMKILFGRALTAAAMIGITLKGEDESLAYRFDGGCKMTVAANMKGEVKGIISDPAWMPLENAPLGTAFGKNGNLTVIKDLGLKEPYSGQIPLVNGEIAADITDYYQKSEQTPFCCSLGVLLNRESEDLSVKAAGGFVIWAMPGCEEELLKKLDGNIAVLPNVTSMLESGMTATDILKAALYGFDFDVTETVTPKYHCDCTREKIELMLLTLPEEELSKLSEDEVTEVVCHWCNTKYSFAKSDLEMYLRVKKREKEIREKNAR